MFLVAGVLLRDGGLRTILCSMYAFRESAVRPPPALPYEPPTIEPTLLHPLPCLLVKVEMKRAYAKASQQAARDSLEMQRAANSEVSRAYEVGRAP